MAALLDAISIVAAFLLVYEVRNAYEPLHDILYYTWILLVVVPIWYGLNVHFGLYRFRSDDSRADVAARVLKAHAAGAVAAAALLFLFQPQGHSRGLFLLFVVASAVILTAQKLIVKEYYLRRTFPDERGRQLLIVGTGAKARRFMDLVRRHGNWGIRILGVVVVEEGEETGDCFGVTILGRLADLGDVCTRYPVDEVIFCPEREASLRIKNYLRPLETMGIRVRVVLDLPDVPSGRKELDLFHGELPVLTLCDAPLSEERMFAKRCLDALGAVVGLMILAFFFPLAALLIKLESRGPIFFGQERVGKNGRRFRCWKFRTMYEDAEQKKEELRALNEMSGGMFKVKNDPRITRVGRALRRTSLDEWPQFWNVLTGEMSLVGPRPLPVGDVGEYEPWQRRRLAVTPGITGLWQVSGRSRVYDFNDVVRMDLAYIDNWNLWMDVKILFRTLFTMFSGHGAY